MDSGYGQDDHSKGRYAQEGSGKYRGLDARNAVTMLTVSVGLAAR